MALKFYDASANLCLSLLLIGLAAWAQVAAAKDFRVENWVFFGDSKEADFHGTTIFHKGVVYDYLDDPAEVIVFDKAAERFVLLDTKRRVRAELTTEYVASFTEQLQRSARDHDDPFVRFSAAPKFDEQYDDKTGELTLSSPRMTYRLRLREVGDKVIASQYREFADWYSRLNSVINPGAKPPSARLLVNAALERYKAFAREVHLTLTPKKTFPPKRVAVRSQHRLVPQVVEADLDRITQTRQFMDIFKPVSFEQYRTAESH